ncbi:MAG: hypothetical protein JSR90_06725 [Proteobacteria bacterium]|nr:hypothetical protein [Pseudomonadota bacterium]
MKRSAVLVALACGLLPGAARADDASYCAELGALARRYLGSAGAQGGLRPDPMVQQAIQDCNAGNTARGIPVLERKLRASGFTLPKRD